LLLFALVFMRRAFLRLLALLKKYVPLPSIVFFSALLCAIATQVQVFAVETNDEIDAGSKAARLIAKADKPAAKGIKKTKADDSASKAGKYTKASTAAQTNNISLAGTWQGALKVGNGMELPLVFHFQQSQGKYNGTMDSPMQGKSGMAFDQVQIDAGGNVRADQTKIKASFVGKVDASKKTIVGTWMQAGNALPLTVRSIEKYQGPKRPQEPREPFPYKSEEVKIENGAAVLAGTLTTPEGTGPFPAVILIHGSGPHDRDETIF
jgi:hypothetical protein